MQEVVGQGGQRLALDETVPGASIGGALATNASGPRRHAVGTARDLLIGITVVRADGVVAKAGGRVVKNVAGYDLGKLLIGSVRHPRRDHRGGLPAAPAARGAALGDRAGRPTRPRRTASVQSVRARPGGARPRSRSTGRSTGRGTRQRAARGPRGRASPAAPRTVRGCSAQRRPSRRDAPAGGATYPWDVAAPATTGPRAEADLRALRARDVLRRGRAVGAAVRGSAGAGVLYAALPAGTPADEVGAALDAAARRLRAARRQRRRGRRARRGQAGRRRVGAGARPST